MTFSELYKFGFWRVMTVFFGKDYYERPVLSKALIIVGKFLILIGTIVFVTAPQWGRSSYDYTVILSDSRLLAANGRVYVFVEEMCAVNVYEENGTFLFCVRGPRSQNGEARMFLSGTDIYIVTRYHDVIRFDENGTYRGTADMQYLYDSHGQPVMTLYITEGGRSIHPDYFDDGGIWYYAWYDDVGHVYFHNDGTNVEVVDRAAYDAVMESHTYAIKDYAETNEAFYWARLNTIRRITHGGIQVFAKTPLYLYYIKSGGLGWLTLVFGLLLKYLADKLFKRKQSKKQSAA